MLVLARRVLILAFLVVLHPSTTFCAGAKLTHEYDLKATFLFHFAQFVGWPSETLADKAPFTIGIIGNDPFGKSLDEIVANESVEGHKLIIRRFQSVSQIDSNRRAGRWRMRSWWTWPARVGTTSSCGCLLSRIPVRPCVQSRLSRRAPLPSILRELRKARHG